MNALTRGALLAVLGLGLAGMASAATTNIERLSLEGLAGLLIQTDARGREAQFGELVNADAFAARVETKIRRAGIKVFETIEEAKGRPFAILTVTVLAIATPSLDEEGKPTMYALSLHIGVSQPVSPAHAERSSKLLVGETWSRNTVLCYGSETLRGGALDRSVGDKLDELVNDWFAANERR